MDQWRNTTIGAEATLQRGFDITRAVQKSGNIPVISSGGVSSYHDTAAVQGPGVVLGRKGVVGSVYYVEEGYWPHDTTLWVKDFHGNHPRFVYYFFKNIAPQIAAMDVGSANPTLNRNHVHPIAIKWPQHRVQACIADILGSLDDKIELNRRTIETLEAMARTLFRSWFVTFDPVRAKAEGRKPDGLDAATAKLFPDKFEDSSLGPVPQGWRVVSLGEYVEVAKGLSYKGEGLAEAGVALHNLNSVYEGGGYKHEGIKHYVGEYRPCHVIRAGDVIVTNTEQGHDHLLIGYSALIPKRHGDLGLFSHHTYRVRPLPESSLTPPFIHHLLLTSRFRGEVIGFTNGTTVNMLPAEGLKRPRLVLPPAELIRRFTDFVVPLIDKAETSYEESRSLTVTRDALLPKLLSGEVRPA